MQDEMRGDILLVVAITLTIISTIFVGARLWARFIILRKAGWDDYTIIPAYVRTLTKHASLTYMWVLTRIFKDHKRDSYYFNIDKYVN